MRDKVHSKMGMDSYRLFLYWHQYPPELPVWGAFIISISESVSKGFLSKFPSLECKLMVMENILSETLYVNRRNCPSTLLSYKHSKDEKGQTKHPVLLCTVGRFSYPKAIDRAVYICRQLVQQGIDVCWYVVSGMAEINRWYGKRLQETGDGKTFRVFGWQTNESLPHTSRHVTFMYSLRVTKAKQ